MPTKHCKMLTDATPSERQILGCFSLSAERSGACTRIRACCRNADGPGQVGITTFPRATTNPHRSPMTLVACRIIDSPVPILLTLNRDATASTPPRFCGRFAITIRLTRASRSRPSGDSRRSAAETERIFAAPTGAMAFTKTASTARWPSPNTLESNSTHAQLHLRRNRHASPSRAGRSSVPVSTVHGLPGSRRIARARWSPAA